MYKWILPQEVESLADVLKHEKARREVVKSPSTPVSSQLNEIFRDAALLNTVTQNLEYDQSEQDVRELLKQILPTVSEQRQFGSVTENSSSVEGIDTQIQNLAAHRRYQKQQKLTKMKPQKISDAHYSFRNQNKQTNILQRSKKIRNMRKNYPQKQLYWRTPAAQMSQINSQRRLMDENDERQDKSMVDSTYEGKDAKNYIDNTKVQERNYMEEDESAKNINYLDEDEIVQERNYLDEQIDQSKNYLDYQQKNKSSSQADDTRKYVGMGMNYAHVPESNNAYDDRNNINDPIVPKTPIFQDNPDGGGFPFDDGDIEEDEDKHYMEIPGTKNLDEQKDKKQNLLQSLRDQIKEARSGQSPGNENQRQFDSNLNREFGLDQEIAELENQQEDSQQTRLSQKKINDLPFMQQIDQESQRLRQSLTQLDTEKRKFMSYIKNYGELRQRTTGGGNVSFARSSGNESRGDVPSESRATTTTESSGMVTTDSRETISNERSSQNELTSKEGGYEDPSQEDGEKSTDKNDTKSSDCNDSVEIYQQPEQCMVPMQPIAMQPVPDQCCCYQQATQCMQCCQGQSNQMQCQGQMNQMQCQVQSNQMQCQGQSNQMQAQLICPTEQCQPAQMCFTIPIESCTAFNPCSVSTYGCGRAQEAKSFILPITQNEGYTIYRKYRKTSYDRCGNLSVCYFTTVTNSKY